MLLLDCNESNNQKTNHLFFKRPIITIVVFSLTYQLSFGIKAVGTYIWPPGKFIFGVQGNNNMTHLETVKQLAQQLLMAPSTMGLANTWLWDRTQRIVRNVDTICNLPEIAEANIAINRFCLTSAAYFADSGFTNYSGTDTPDSGLVLSDINVADLREFSAQLVSEHLSSHIEQVRIDKINRIILESNNRFCEMPEAMILSDARNLDDIGMVGLFNDFCACGVHGKGVSDALQSWKKKVDYRYWQARLKEGFRFDSVRQIATARYEQAESFMYQLEIENSTKDIEEVKIEQITQNTKA